MTKEPVWVNPDLARLCIGPSAGMVAEARKRSGPHAHTLITVYMNDLAAAAFRSGENSYPVGSVVVKEKSADPYRTGEEDLTKWTKHFDGAGGMIKRSPGYDAGHGDWEYFYRDDATGIEHGRMTSCVRCHSSAAGSDYVFGDWAARN